MTATPDQVIAQIRHQLEINVQIAERDHPEGPIIDGKRVKGVCHSQDILAQHIREHLDVLEVAIKEAEAERDALRKALEPLFARADKWQHNSDNARVSVKLGDLRRARTLSGDKS